MFLHQNLFYASYHEKPASNSRGPAILTLKYNVFLPKSSYKDTMK